MHMCDALPYDATTGSNYRHDLLRSRYQSAAMALFISAHSRRHFIAFFATDQQSLFAKNDFK